MHAASGVTVAAAPTLRRFGPLIPRVIVVGASTGGPQALLTLLTHLASSLAAVPVIVVLHMPDGFTTVISDHLARASGVPVRVARNGESVQVGHVYLADHGVHSMLMRTGDALSLMHSRAPPSNFCRPAVDVLFRSAVAACGPAVLGVVLTGMGTDGLAGATAIVEAGGSIVAQDEATSVVWGMPGAVARAGLCAAIAPVDTLAARIAVRLRAAGPAVCA